MSEEDSSSSSFELSPTTIPSVLHQHNDYPPVNNGPIIQNYQKQAGPYIEIVEQPKSRGFRFRYACEGKSHGGLQGENSDKNRKTYPSIKIHNYNGMARVIVKLVTDERIPRPHAHELIGKDCKDGVCVMNIKPERAQTEIIFSNLGILHVTKKRVAEILTTRLMEDMRDMKISKDTFYSSDINSIQLSEAERKKAKAQAAEQAKNMTLNVVCLCFQVHLIDENNHTKILPSVISQPIYDCKSPGAAALKICRMDRHAGFCTGQEEVFLLCDKVQKEDIAVRFFEKGQNGQAKWEDYGSFGPADVHRQYAIVFRTPPYADTSIDKPVDVYVQLKRLTDGETSDPKPFTYIPLQKDQDEVNKKKLKAIPCFPNIPTPVNQNVTVLTQPINGGIHTIQGQVVNGMTTAYQVGQQPQKVPVYFNGANSGMTTIQNTTSSQMFYPSNTTVSQINGQTTVPSLQNFQNGQLQFNQMSSYFQNGHTQQMTPRGVTASPPMNLSKKKLHNGIDNPDGKLDTATKLSKRNNKNDIETDSCPFEDDDIDVVDGCAHSFKTRLTSIQQNCDSGYKSYYASVTSTSITEQSSSINREPETPPTPVTAISTEIVTPASNNDIVVQGEINSDLTVGQEASIKQEDMHKTPIVIEASAPVEVKPMDTSYEPQAGQPLIIQPIETNVNGPHLGICEEKDIKHEATNTGPELEMTSESMQDLAWRVAENTALALQYFAKTGNIAYLLVIQRHLVAVQDEHGDNALHMAIIHRRLEPLRHLLLAASSLQDCVAINTCNSLQQTPLHLAVITNQPEIIELLVKYRADVSLIDRHGNTAAHLAAINGYDRCLQGLITTFLSLHGPMLSLNHLNYDGFSALHLAVRCGNLNCVRHLVAANVDINLVDGKSGYTALHHAAEMENLGIVGYLLLEAGADPNVPAFSGNSALHIAVGRDLLSVAALLMASGADPAAECSELPNNDSDEDAGYNIKPKSTPTKEDDEMYEEGITPMDMAQGNERMLKILRGEPYSLVSDNASQLTRDTTSLYSGILDSGLGLGAQEGDLEQLDLVTRVKMARLLDQADESEGWEKLAELVGMVSLVSALRPMKSPTRALLDNLEVLDCTISKLKEALSKMQRQDAIEIIDEGLSLHDQVAKERADKRAKDPVGYNYQNYMLDSQFGSLSIRSQQEQ